MKNIKNVKILFISKFFYPDLNPPSFRFYEMLKFIKRRTNWEITVITTLPHYRIINNNIVKKKIEEVNGIKVYRIKCPRFKKKTISIFYELYIQNLLSDIIFILKTCIKLLFLGKHDVVICTSPPVFVLITGIFSHIIYGSDLIVDVRDLWIENKIESKVLNSKILIKIFKLIEQVAFNKAKIITCTTNSIKNIIANKTKNKKIIFIPNGIDKTMIFKKDSKIKDINKTRKFTILYAGRVGRLQNLSSLIDGFAQLEGNRIQFIIIGDGPDLDIIENAKKNGKIKNVEILPPQNRQIIKKFYSKVDALLVHLKNIESLKYTIPSKIFEYMGSNKPIIYGVLGEAKKILDESNSGIWFFPEDINSFINAVINLKNNYKLYIEKISSRKKYVINYYNREKIALKLLNIIRKLIEN